MVVLLTTREVLCAGRALRRVQRPRVDLAGPCAWRYNTLRGGRFGEECSCRIIGASLRVQYNCHFIQNIHARLLVLLYTIQLAYAS